MFKEKYSRRIRKFLRPTLLFPLALERARRGKAGERLLMIGAGESDDDGNPCTRRRIISSGRHPVFLLFFSSESENKSPGKVI